MAFSTASAAAVSMRTPRARARRIALPTSSDLPSPAPPSMTTVAERSSVTRSSIRALIAACSGSRHHPRLAGAIGAARPRCPVHRHRLGASLQHHRLERLEPDALVGRLRGRVAAEDLALAGLHQARREVDHLAVQRVLAAQVAAEDPEKARPVATPTVHDRPISSSSRRSVSAAVIARRASSAWARGGSPKTREGHPLLSTSTFAAPSKRAITRWKAWTPRCAARRRRRAAPGRGWP